VINSQEIIYNFKVEHWMAADPPEGHRVSRTVQRGLCVGVMTDPLSTADPKYDHRFWVFALGKCGYIPSKEVQTECDERLLTCVTPKFGVYLQQVAEHDNPYDWLKKNQKAKVLVHLNNGRVGAVQFGEMQCFDGSYNVAHLNLSNARIYQVGKWGKPIKKKKNKAKDGPLKLMLSSTQAQGFSPVPLCL
jgi:hypothetical protein